MPPKSAEDQDLIAVDGEEMKGVVVMASTEHSKALAAAVDAPFDIAGNDQETQALAEFKKRIPEALTGCNVPEVIAWANEDGTLLRYLRARKLKVDDAYKMIAGSIKWRAETKPWALECSACAANPMAHNARQVGYDLKGRPILFTSYSQSPERFDHKVWADHFGMLFVSTVNNSAKRGTVKNPSGKLSWFWDLGGFSKWDCKPVLSMYLVAMLNHYPEALGVCFLYDAPRMYSFLWNMIAPHLDEVTSSKILFIPGPNAGDKYKEVMAPHFDIEMIEWFGRECAESRDPTVCDTRQHWEWRDESGELKPHDPRGTASFVKGEDWYTNVKEEHIMSRFFE